MNIIDEDMTVSIIREKITKGAYSPKSPYVRVRTFKGITDAQLIHYMKGPGRDLTLSEATESLTALMKKQYESDMENLKRHHAELNQGIVNFHKDVMLAFGICEIHPLWASFRKFVDSACSSNDFNRCLDLYEALFEAFGTLLHEYEFVIKRR